MRISGATIKITIVLGGLTTLLAGTGAVTAVPAGAAAHTAAGARAVTVSSPWSQTDDNAASSRANLTEQTLTRATVAKVQWLRSMAAPPAGTAQACSPQVVAPVLTGGALYAAANDVVTRYSPATGRVVWRHVPSASFVLFSGYTALSVARGVVVAASVDCVSESDPVGSVETFSAATGAPGWSVLGGEPDFHMVVSGGFVVTGGNSDTDGATVTVYKLTTGAVAWSRNSLPCPSFTGAAEVIAKLVVSYDCTEASGQTLAARRLGTGTTVWSRSGGTWQLQRGDTDTTASRHLYAVNPHGTVVALDPLTGKTLYSLAGASQVLAVDSTRAYAQCDGTDNVCAYNSTSGRLRWEAHTDGTVSIAAEAGGVLYLGDGPALNTGTGQMITALWGDLISGPVQASALAVGDGRIAAVTDPRVLDLYGLPGF
jgi:putative pyrroloquinoline-quinone binding quinoprotein